MLTDSRLALAARAGQAMVAVASTSEWDTASREYAKLLGQGDVNQTRLARQRLKETHEQLAGAAGPDSGLIGTALAVRWAGRIADLLEENPDVEGELDALVQ